MLLGILDLENISVEDIMIPRNDITGIDLNQYQNQLSQARIDLLVAKINYRLELLNMKIQSLYDFREGRPVVLEQINSNDNDN